MYAYEIMNHLSFSPAHKFNFRHKISTVHVCDLHYTRVDNVRYFRIRFLYRV
jgi:hypothetical protein